MKKEILAMLESVEREGIESLINWLENETDYFTAPASTKYHHAYEGGLAKHSLGVYDCLNDVLKMDQFQNIKCNNMNSRILCALLHDICKTNFYKISEKNVKDESTGK